MPKVSVFIPVFNTETFIAEAIESVLNQTFTDFELVIVDDCSTDDSFKICGKYATSDDRIRLYRNEQNLGMMPNWNHGLSLCKGEYWGKLDADDLWTDTMLEKCLLILDQNPSIGMVCSRHIEIDKNGEIYSNTVSNPPNFTLNKSFSFVPFVKSGISMLQHNVARQGIGLIRKSFFDQYGNYLMIQPADTELYFRIGAHYEVHCIDEILHNHRIWEASDTRATILNNPGKIEKNLFDVRNAILKHYYTSQKITYEEYKQFKKDNLFEFSKFQAYFNRTQKKYLLMMKFLFSMTFLRPIGTVRFYYNRLFVSMKSENKL